MSAFAVGLGALSYALAVASKGNDWVFWAVQQTLLFPLLLLAGILLPIDGGPGWMRFLSDLNPLTYVVDAERVLFAGDLLDAAVLQGAARRGRDVRGGAVRRHSRHPRRYRGLSRRQTCGGVGRRPRRRSTPPSGRELRMRQLAPRRASVHRSRGRGVGRGPGGFPASPGRPVPSAVVHADLPGADRSDGRDPTRPCCAT